jgi:hypothetical protein
MYIDNSKNEQHVSYKAVYIRSLSTASVPRRQHDVRDATTALI